MKKKPVKRNSLWNGGVKMAYEIREMDTSEYGVLSDFLYEAIFQRDDNNRYRR